MGALAIEDKLSDAGYRMLGDNKDIEKLILDILKTEKIRYLKAIPFLIYKYNIDTEILKGKTKNIELLNAILDLTAWIFNELNIRKKISRYKRDKSKLEGRYSQKLAPHYKKFKEEFKKEFELQLKNEKLNTPLIDKQKIYAERELQFWLSKIFTLKEKKIIKRILEEKPISKTDYEYYSRKTKKKLNAIINLEDFAKTILSISPEKDEEIFKIKRELEDFIKRLDIEGTIEKYEIYKNKIIMIITDNHNEELITSFSLDKIKDKTLLKMIKGHGDQDFS